MHQRFIKYRDDDIKHAYQRRIQRDVVLSLRRTRRDATTHATIKMTTATPA